MADTDLQQLVINVGTKAQIEAGISGGTITQDMLSVATDSTDYVTDVQVNSTSVTTNGVANIDLTGKQDVLTSGTGIDITSNVVSNSGVRSISTGGTNGTISVNTNGTSAEVAVKGLGTAAYTSTTDYATSAQGTKADTAIQGINLGGTAQTPDANKVVNIPLATNSYVGVCRGSTPNGVIASSGVLSIVGATSAEVISKTNAYHPLTPSVLDNAVKVGVTTNTNILTSSEQATACSWLGASQQTIFRDWT